MSRLSLLNSPLLLGFEEIERTLDRLAKAGGDGYPPYNIEQTGQDALRITVAVAGFSQSELDVTLEDRQLVIRGHQADDKERVYLHRGIAARQFQRAFVLADGMEVARASLEDGLLSVDLVRPQPRIVARTIKIETAPPTGGGAEPIGLAIGKTGKAAS